MGQPEAGRAPLPDLTTPGAYRRVFERPRGITAAVRAIADRHGLGGVSLRRFPQGTNFVYAAGADHVVKLYAPLYAADCAREREGLLAVAPELGSACPALMADGSIDGWPYLVLRRLRGRPAVQVWGTLSATAREDVAEQIGHMIAAIQRVRPPTEGPLAGDWDAFLTAQVAGAEARHAAGAPGAPWLDALPAFLAAHRSEWGAPRRVLLHGDLTDGNLLLAPRGRRWHVVGVIDFSVALTGAPAYDFVAPAYCLARGDGRIAQAVYRGAGTPPQAPEVLLAWALVHRFARLAPMTRRASAQAGDLGALARALFGDW